MLNFAILPPEINSSRMYSGPGASSWLAASQMWDALATELHSAYVGYNNILDELHQHWHGPSALIMRAAITPYLSWLIKTSENAHHTSSQLRAAAHAYETAFQMTVPPIVIAENRQLLASLIATNFFGQNTGAIAMTQMHYAHMWVQDALAMFFYVHHAHAAAHLFQFHIPRSPIAHHQALTILSKGTHHITENIVQFIQQSGLWVIPPELASDLLGTFGFDIVSNFGFGVVGLDEEIADELIPLEIFESIDLLPLVAEIGQADLVGQLSIPTSWTSTISVLVHSFEQSTHSLSLSHREIHDSNDDDTSIPIYALTGFSLTAQTSALIEKNLSSQSQMNSSISFSPQISNHSSSKLDIGSQLAMIINADGELSELAKLHHEGLLTDHEYHQQRQRLMHR